MVDNDTSEYQYLLSSSKNGLYTDTSDKNELANYVYNEPFYTPIFNHRNTVFNTEINKFNIYRSNFTKISILDIHIYEPDLSRVIYSDIKVNPNKII